MGALAVLPLSGLRSHGGHQPAPPGLVKGVKPEVGSRAGRLTKWRPKPCSIWGLRDCAGVLSGGLLDWGHVGSSF